METPTADWLINGPEAPLLATSLKTIRPGTILRKANAYGIMVMLAEYWQNIGRMVINSGRTVVNSLANNFGLDGYVGFCWLDIGIHKELTASGKAYWWLRIT